MPIFRGPGGAGDATNDATVTAVQAAATSAATSATNAANSATAAANSATGAATSATNASNSATTAAGQATTAAGHATNASTFATNSSLSADDSADSATEAEGYASEAFDYKVAAASSASSASTSATNAAASSATATTAVNNALSLYGDAAALDAAVTAAQLAETNAETAETNAETAATTATNAASTATTQATNAAASAVAADADATSASTDANEAQAAATAAQAAVSSATAIYGSIEDIQQAEANSEANRDAAAASAGAASTSATTATTQAGIATTQATNAATSAAAASAVALGNEPVRHSVRPSLLLDFANTKTLDPRITFTRASTGTFYDGKTVAKAEENLLTYSQEFDNASWAKNSLTVTANATTSPDGTTTAEKLISDNGATTGRISLGATVTGSTVLSVFAKASEWGWVLLAPVGSTVGVYFNLSTGAVGTQSSGYVGTITSVGSGWYRCSVTYTGAGTAQVVRIYPTNADNTISTGNGTNGIFIWGAQLEQRSSVTAYTATTTAPITNYIPALQTAASGVARFEHNPVTGESLGLEIEEQRTNLVTYSDDFSNAAWTKSLLSVTSNTITAPDGTLTGDKLVEDTSLLTHSAQQSANIVSGTSYTLSCYVKAAGRNFTQLLMLGGFASNITAIFDLTTGAVGTTNGSPTTQAVNVGNGWWRLSMTATATSTTTTSIQLRPAFSSSNAFYQGDGYSGIYIWGAQLEAGAFATSYIPTVASQVTRSVDAASMTGTNFSSWYRADEGSIYFDFVAPSDISAVGGIGKNTFDSNIRFNVVNVARASGSEWSQSLTLGTAGVGARKMAVALKRGDYASSVNGATVATSTNNATVPTFTTLNIGTSYTGDGTILNGTIKKIAYYPRRLTNAELVSLSTV